jgi:hypothetical protein
MGEAPTEAGGLLPSIHPRIPPTSLPHERGITDPAKRAEADARDLAFQGAMAKAFEEGLPSARVIWLAHADHYVFRSHESDVLREMNSFIASLPLKTAVRRN